MTSSASKPDAVATPEGDNEFDPSAPLTPTAIEATVAGLQIPRGNAPADYDADHEKGHDAAHEKAKPGEHSSLLEAIDEISRGKIQP